MGMDRKFNFIFLILSDSKFRNFFNEFLEKNTQNLTLVSST